MAMPQQRLPIPLGKGERAISDSVMVPPNAYIRTASTKTASARESGVRSMPSSPVRTSYGLIRTSMATQRESGRASSIVWDRRPTSTTVYGNRLQQALSLRRPSLLRGTKSGVVLSRCGALLAASAGDAQTYRLSRGVPRLNTFISHNWATGRLPKFLVIALFFNFKAMVFTMAVTSTAMLALMATEVVPSSYFIDNRGVVWATSTNCSAIGTVSALLALFLWHEISAQLGHGKDVFLDKTCIHQTDEARMREGIESLGAFVCQSEWLLVVYSDLYLQKLWTVYELCTYLCYHPARHLVIMPLWFPVIFLFVHLLISAYAILENIYQVRSVQQDVPTAVRLGVRFVVVWMLVFCACVVMRFWCMSRESFRTQVSNFRIRSASCFMEADRVQIERNVADMMRCAGLVSADAQAGTALDAFEALIHAHLPQIVARGFDKVCSYKYCAFMSVGLALKGLDVLAIMFVKRDPGYKIALWFVHYVTTAALVLPIAIGLVTLASRRCLRLRGIANGLYMLLLSIATDLLLTTMWLIHYTLCLFVEDSDGAMWDWVVMLCYTAVLAACTRGVFVFQQKPPALLARAAVETPGLLISKSRSLRSIISGHSAKSGNGAHLPQEAQPEDDPREPEMMTRLSSPCCSSCGSGSHGGEVPADIPPDSAPMCTSRDILPWPRNDPLAVHAAATPPSPRDSQQRQKQLQQSAAAVSALQSDGGRGAVAPNAGGARSLLCAPASCGGLFQACSMQTVPAVAC